MPLMAHDLDGVANNHTATRAPGASGSLLPMPMSPLRILLGLAALAAAACWHAEGKYKELSVDEVVQLQGTTAVTFVDANTADYRKENGVIPDAILLADGKYEPAAVLPEDKTAALVFYCSNRL